MVSGAIIDVRGVACLESDVAKITEFGGEKLNASDSLLLLSPTKLTPKKFNEPTTLRFMSSVLRTPSPALLPTIKLLLKVSEPLATAIPPPTLSALLLANVL